MGDLVKAIKKAAMDAYRNSDPTKIMFGTVIQVNPLKIQVNQKLFIAESQLILTRNVTDYKITVSFDLESSEELGNHKHGISLNTGNALGTHSHSYFGNSDTGANIPSGTIPAETLQHTHTYSGTTQTADLTHNHSVSGDTQDTNLKHKHTIKGTKEITVKNALQVGEKVILIRQDGGQEYIVIDRVGDK